MIPNDVQPDAAGSFPGKKWPAQPSASRIRVAETGDQLIFHVPLTGFAWKSIITLLQGLALEEIMFLCRRTPLEFFAQPTWEHFKVAAVCLAFWCMGVGAMVSALQFLFRRARIVARPGELRWQKRGPFWTSRYRLPAENLSAVRVGVSDDRQSPGREIYELQIVAGNGPVRGFLVGRDPVELYWVAEMLEAYYFPSR